MPEWVHNRAEHILAKNPSMPKGMAFAVATQQAHATGHAPKGFGTSEGKAKAKAKFDTPKNDEQRANPGGLDSPKLAAVIVRIVKQAGFMDLARQAPTAMKALPGAAKSLVSGATPHMEHLNEIGGLGVLAVPSLDKLQAKARASFAGDRSEHAVEKRQLMGEGGHAALEVGGLGMLAGPALAKLKHAFANSAYAGNVAQNGPGMKSHSQLPSFTRPALQVKESDAQTLRNFVGKLKAKRAEVNSKTAGVGIGAGMSTSQYSGPLSYGAFKMTSGIPPFKRTSATKYDESLDAPGYMTGQNKESAARSLVRLFCKEASSTAATGAMSPAASLNATQRVAGPKTTGFSGPSIADVAKPKGFGTPMPGAQKNQI